MLVQMGGQFALARNVPAIHDISTDPVDPPAFVAVVPLRASAPNGLDYDRETLAPLMAEHYADLAPLVIDADPAAVFSRAEAVVAAQGWTLVASDPAGGSLRLTIKRRSTASLTMWSFASEPWGHGKPR